MGRTADRIIGGLIAVSSAALGAAATAITPVPVWIPITLAALGAAGGLVKVGWFGGGSNE